MSDIKKTESSNWKEAQELLEKGKISEATKTEEIPKNEKKEYSVIVITEKCEGHIWGATRRYNTWFDVQDKPITAKVIAWQVHQKIKLQKKRKSRSNWTDPNETGAL